MFEKKLDDELISQVNGGIDAEPGVIPTPFERPYVEPVLPTVSASIKPAIKPPVTDELF